MWPHLNTVMEKAQTWDRDGDGMIENAGFPDQTYDLWTMTGPRYICLIRYYKLQMFIKLSLIQQINLNGNG